MKNKYLKNLELDVIRGKAVEYAVCAESKERIFTEAPMTNKDDVTAALRQTDFLAALLLKYSNPRISSCAGAEDAVARAEKSGVLSPAELLSVARALRNFSRLDSWYAQQENADVGIGAMDDYFFSVQPQEGLEKRIHEAILSESEIADTASDELYQLRRKICQTEGEIRSRLDSFVKSQSTSKYLQDAIVSIRNGRFVVPVKSEHKGDVGGVIHDVSASGGTVFIEPTAVVEANAKILQLQNLEQVEIQHILSGFSDEVAQISPFFNVSYLAMIEIDVRLAKAELGLTMNGICPKVNDTMCFSFIKARHPLLDKKTVVPVDIQLGDGYDTLIVTGPNTGGKTVSLKTAGLLSAMAQLGYLLPAHDSTEVCVFEHILVDIGDEQSIEQSLSTFSAHIKNITEIFMQVNEKSLVLLDELGAGTDPAEGAALAISIIETLRMHSAKIMATTHYAELKMFALDTQGVQNAGSEFNVETLRPTYKLIVGVPGRSNAFLISEKLGISPDIIKNARRHMSNEQQRFETVLSQLEDLKLEVNKQQEEIGRLKYEADHQLETAQNKRDELIRQGEAELADARAKAKKLAEDVENSAYSLLDEIKRMEKDERLSNAQKAQRAREIAKKQAEELLQKAIKGEVKNTDYMPLASVQIGQEVFVPDMNKAATVTALPDKTYNVEIRMGAVKTKVPLIKLSGLPKEMKKNRPLKKGSSTATRSPSLSRTEINLLGQTVDEALMEVDQFIDDCYMSRLETIYVIHGRGTGALRSAIHRHLRTHKNVKAFRLGHYGEGEDGVTVVELK